MKIKVERTRINYEKLHEKLHEKDNGILCVQMELGEVKANNKFMFQLFLFLIKVFHITFNLLAIDLGVDDNQSVMAHGSTRNDFFDSVIVTSTMGQRDCHPLIPMIFSILFIKLLLGICYCNFLGEFWMKRCKGNMSLPIHANVEDNWKMCLIVMVVPTIFFFSPFLKVGFLHFFFLLFHFSYSTNMLLNLEFQYPWHHVSILSNFAYVSWLIT